MSSKVLFVLFLCAFQVISSDIIRDKRTIGILFRGLVDAVTGPTATLAYPPDQDRRTTPKPDSRPQTQIFFVQVPEKQRQQPQRLQPQIPSPLVKPPAPLRPADLAEIHIHPNLVKQLESLVRAQAIRGKMVAKRFPLNTENDVDDNIKAGDEPEVSKAPPTSQAPLESVPMKYSVKILPEDNTDKEAISILITTGKDGKIKIIPTSGKNKIQIEPEKITGKPDDVELIDKGNRSSSVVPPTPNTNRPPYQEYYPPYPPGIGSPDYYYGDYGHRPFPDPQRPFPDPQKPFSDPQRPYPDTLNVPQTYPPPIPNVPQSYSQSRPYDDFLSLLGLTDTPPNQQPQITPPNNPPPQNPSNQIPPPNQALNYPQNNINNNIGGNNYNNYGQYIPEGLRPDYYPTQPFPQLPPLPQQISSFDNFKYTSSPFQQQYYGSHLIPSYRYPPRFPFARSDNCTSNSNKKCP